MIILWNRKFIAEKDASIPLLSDAVLFGFGAFETLRVNQDGYVIELDAHIQRLKRSLLSIGLPLKLTDEELAGDVHRIVQKKSGDLQRLRIMVVPEGIAVISFPLSIDMNIYNGVSVKSVVQHRAIPSVKSLSYLECLLSYREATSEGFFEAILVDEKRDVFEGSRSNLFWVRDNRYYTRETGVLEGITRKLVLESVNGNVKFSNIDLAGLKQADEVFMSGSTVGVVPVTRIDDSTIGTGKPGKLTLEVIAALKKYYY